MRKLLLTLVLAISFLVPVGVMAAPGGVTDPDVLKDLAALRRATAQYHDIQNALDAGYVLEEHPHCVEGMGVHVVKPTLIDAELDPLQPEALLYVTQGDRFKLVAVEYIVPDELVTEEVPSLFGRPLTLTPFLRQYDLHAWIWQANPDGIFAPFNQNVSCPSS